MSSNTIKVKQIDNNDLFSFLQAQLGLTIAGTNTTNIFNHTFNNPVTVKNTLSISGTSLFAAQGTFQAGLIANSGVYVQGNVSGQSATFDTFNFSARI